MNLRTRKVYTAYYTVYVIVYILAKDTYRKVQKETKATYAA